MSTKLRLFFGKYPWLYPVFTLVWLPIGFVIAAGYVLVTGVTEETYNALKGWPKRHMDTAKQWNKKETK